METRGQDTKRMDAPPRGEAPTAGGLVVQARSQHRSQQARAGQVMSAQMRAGQQRTQQLRG